MSRSDHYAKPLPLNSNEDILMGRGKAGQTARYVYSYAESGQDYRQKVWSQGNTPPVIGPFKTKKACDEFIFQQNIYLARLRVELNK